MELQEDISMELQSGIVGEVVEVLIDREDNDYYVGRTQYDSPEVDPEVLVKKTKALRVGEFCLVKVEQAYPFELIAEPI